MSESAAQPPEPNDGDGPLSGLHYLLIFTSFGLIVLVLMGPRYQKLQVRNEQQYRGIQEMQRREQQAYRERRAGATTGKTAGTAGTAAAGQGGRTDGTPEPLAEEESQPLIISLRPLMIVLAALMLIAWGGITWQRFGRTAARNPRTGPRPEK